MISVLNQGGRWVRASHTEMLSAYPEGSRPYHLEMPLLTEDMGALMDYPHRPDIAMGIPIALPGASEIGELRFEGFVKSALLLVRQMLHFWDVRSRGIPIYIGVSENGLQSFREYARLCDFPESQVLSLPSYADDWAGWLIKMDMLTRLADMGYARLLHFDASLFLESFKQVYPKAVFENLCRYWQTQEWAICRHELRLSADNPFRFCAMDGKYAAQDPALYAKLGDVLGTSEESERDYWSGPDCEFVSGQVVGCMAWQWLQHQVLISRLCDITSHDEVIFSVVAREAGMVGSVVLNLYDILEGLCYMAAYPNGVEDEVAHLHQWRTSLGYSHEMAMPAHAYPSSVLD